MWLKHTAFQVGFNDCAWRTTLLIQWIQLKSLTATTWMGIKRRISRILHFQCTWKLHGNALDYPTISNLVSDGCGSWISHKHSLWCSVLKPQHFRLLTLRWDSSLPTSKWPAASWEHWTSQPWTFKSCKAAASIPAEHLGWNSFLFPVLWPNLLGFTHGHFNAVLRVKPSSSSSPPKHSCRKHLTLTFFASTCTLYCPFHFSKWALLQNLPQLVSPLCGTMGHVPSVPPAPSRNIEEKLQAALTLNKSPFRALKIHHY